MQVSEGNELGEIVPAEDQAKQPNLKSKPQSDI
jgi:hypothetical protein